MLEENITRLLWLLAYSSTFFTMTYIPRKRLKVSDALSRDADDRNPPLWVSGLVQAIANRFSEIARATRTNCLETN